MCIFTLIKKCYRGVGVLNLCTFTLIKKFYRGVGVWSYGVLYDFINTCILETFFDFISTEACKYRQNLPNYSNVLCWRGGQPGHSFVVACKSLLVYRPIFRVVKKPDILCWIINMPPHTTMRVIFFSYLILIGHLLAISISCHLELSALII